MQRKFYLGLSVLLVVLGIAVVADALVVTDSEQLDAFVETLTKTDPGERIDGALHYANPALVEIDVHAGGDRDRYSDGEEVEMADHLRDALGALDYGDLDLVQRTVRVEGDEGFAALRIDTDDGMVDAEFRFARHGERWLLRRVRVR